MRSHTAGKRTCPWPRARRWSRSPLTTGDRACRQASAGEFSSRSCASIRPAIAIAAAPGLAWPSPGGWSRATAAPSRWRIARAAVARASACRCRSRRRCERSVLDPHAQKVGGRLRQEVELRALALAREQLPPRGVEIEQQLAPRRIAHEAARPADRREARATRHVGDAVERGGGVGDERAGIELESLLTRRALDRELAAVVARGV